MRFKLLGYIFCIICLGFYLNNSLAATYVRGIYVTQNTLERTAAIKYLIQRSKEVGINTFVIDFRRMTRRYRRNIVLVKQAHIKYVARIVVFPHGGTNSQIRSQKYWQGKYKLAEQALSLGAAEIQLDYVRYKPSNQASSQNARDIYQVIKYFYDHLQARGIPLQIDVFGIATQGEAKNIGQNLLLFANAVDAMCPMVYPSHYEPYPRYSRQPYYTVFTALKALHKQFDGDIPFKVYPYVEASNYRYRHSGQAKLQYIYAQIKAVQDSNVNGWYVWSPNNKYGYLFRVLKNYKF